MDWLPLAISGVGGLLVGLIPKLIDALKARTDSARKDRNVTYSEQRQLLTDLRIERDNVRKELDEVRQQHQDCLQITSRQTEQISWLNKVVEQQQRDIAELKAK